MRTRTLLTLLLAFVAVSLALWDFAPRTSSQGKPRDIRTREKESPDSAEKGTSGIGQILPELDQDQKRTWPLTADSQSADDDPDLPPGLSGRIDKEAYLQARGDYIDMLRGLSSDETGEARSIAIQQMAEQERGLKLLSRFSLAALVNTMDWKFLGPAPIPLGQTSPTRVPVSGRTIAIAVHPTDPDTVYVGTAQGGLYKSTNGGANWTKLFEFELETLAIGAITIDPTDTSIVYVGSGETSQSADSFLGRGLYIIRNANSATLTLTGPFRQNGLGANVFNFRSIGRIRVNPLDHNVIWVSSTSGSGGNPNTTVQPSAPARGLYRSTNAQSANPTFEQIPVLPLPYDRSAVDVVVDPNNPNLLITSLIGVGGDGGIYQTTNALSATPTFTRTLTLPDGSTNGRAKLYLNSNGGIVTVFAATGEIATIAGGAPANCTANSAGLVRRSIDGGQTWSVPLGGSTGFCGGQCFYDITIAASPDNQNIFLGGAARGNTSAQCTPDVMRRSVGGANFVRMDNTLHADEHALAIAPSNSQVVYTGNDGGIWRSGDNGTTWVSRNNIDFSATQFQGVAVHPFDRYFLIGGTQDNGTNCLASDGVTWSHCRDGDGGYAIIDNNAPDTFNVLMYHTFFNQTNSQIGYERAANTTANADGQLSGWTFRGCSGTSSNNGFRCADNVLFYAPMEQGPGNPNTLYFGTDRLYRSTNRGDTMTLASQGPLVPTSPGALSGIVVTTIGVSRQDDNVRIVGLRNGRVFVTTTGSTTLTDVTGANFPAPNPVDPLRNSIGHAVIDPNHKFTAYVTFTSFTPPLGQQIFKTTNLNDPTPTWIPISNGIPVIPVSSLAVDPQDSNSLYAGTDIGVYHSSDGGANWTPFGTGLPRVAVFDLKISNVQRFLRIATHGRGIWEIGVPGRQLPVVQSSGTTLVAEGCTPGNGVIDAGEDVTVSLAVRNVGAGPTEDLVVTLLPTGGVTFPTGPVHYGVVDAGTTAAQNFRFSNNGACGDTITLTFHLRDGALDLGNVSVNYTLGVLQTGAPAFTENFDGVTAPALPAGWTTTKTPATGNPPLWVTNTTLRDTVPNSAFGAGSTTPGETILTSPTIPIPAAPAIGGHPGVQLAFKTLYNTEANFDGGVLEISVNGGAFQDILAAGGSFAAGGYNGVIGPTDSVLNLRQAWTGNSGGFISTQVNLPASAFGQNAQFRWRVAYDTGTSPAGGGLRIDTLSIYTVTYICCGGACVITCPSNVTVPNDPGLCGATVTYPAPTFTGNCGTVTPSQASGTFFPVGTTPVVVTGQRLDGTFDSCSFNVTVNDTEFPVVSSAAVDKPTLWPPNHQMEPVTVRYAATDNCSIDCVLTVTSNEPINGLGDGDTEPDWLVIDAHHLLLRSERSGKAKWARTYTITVTCSDPAGNTVVRTVTVSVPFSLGKN